jgi:hypothetical protein
MTVSPHLLPQHVEGHVPSNHCSLGSYRYSDGGEVIPNRDLKDQSSRSRSFVYRHDSWLDVMHTWPSIVRGYVKLHMETRSDSDRSSPSMRQES